MMARVPREFSTVVLDTNVVVAALLWDGVPRALLKLAAAEQSVAAVAARASLVITGDRSHLLPIGRHEGIAIVTPRAALEFFGKSL